MNKSFALTALTVITLPLLAACSKSSASTTQVKQVLNWPSYGEVTTMDPAKNNDVYGSEQLGATLEGLVRLGNNSKILPGIAKSWTESKDGKTLTFTLRKNARWSNGDQVTAQDFVYAFRRQVNPKTASTQSYNFSGVKNADAILKSKKPVSSLGVKATGKYKLTITLERKVPYFKLLLASSPFAPQNKKFIEKCGKKYGTAGKYTLSDGAFVMKGWTGSNLTWKLVKNPYYYAKSSVKLTKINFTVVKSQSTSYNLYQAGKLDMTTLSATQSKSLKGKSGWQIKQNDRSQYLMYNFKTDKNLRNRYLRLAISAAINKATLAKTLNAANVPATSLTPKGIADKATGKDFSQEVITKSNKALQAGDKTLAKTYYQKALKQLGKKQITIKLLGDDTDDAKKTTEFIQSALESTLGMKVEVTNMPFKNRFAKEEAGDFDVILDGWSSDYADPNSFLEMFQKSNVNNYGSWYNTAYDTAVAKSKTASSTKARWAYLRQAEKILLSEQGVTPLYYGNTASLVNPKLKGITLQGAGLAYDFRDAYFVN